MSKAEQEFADHLAAQWKQPPTVSVWEETEYTLDVGDADGFSDWERGLNDECTPRATRNQFTAWEDVRKEAGQTSQRAQLLDEAKDLITGDRNNHYGPPHEDFQRTANIMSSLGFEFDELPIQAHHVAMIMATVKLSRMTWSPDKKDNWVDLAGYAACGWEARKLTTPLPYEEEQ